MLPLQLSILAKPPFLLLLLNAPNGKQRNYAPIAQLEVVSQTGRKSQTGELTAYVCPPH